MSHHRRAAGVVAFAVTLLALVGAPAALADEGTGDTGLQRLAIRRVDSTDAAHVRVSFMFNGALKDLTDLTLREDGRQVKVAPAVPLSKAGTDVAIVFVVDTSKSMGRNSGLRQARASMRRVIGRKGPGDAIGIVGFGEEPTVYAKLTTDRAEALSAVDGIASEPVEATALWDGVKQGAALFDGGEALQPNMVVITDGHDNRSQAKEASARGEVARAGAAMFAMAYGGQGTADTDGLGRMVRTAGGRLFTTPAPEPLGQALATVGTSLHNQYVVEYASAASSGATDLELAVPGARDEKTFVPGVVAQGDAALEVVAAGRSTGPEVLTTGLGKYLAMSAIFLAVGLAVYAVAILVTKQESALDHALLPYTDGYTPEPEPDGSLAQTALMQRAVEITQGLAERRGLLSTVEAKLEKANLPLRAAEALVVYLAAVVLVTVFGLLVMGLMGMVLGLLLAGLVPVAVLNHLGRRRQKQFNAQLPDMLQLLAGSLRAGYSFLQGVEAVSQEVGEPMGKELRRVCSEARLGRELEDALDGVGQRMESADFEWAVMAVRIQREVGGNLAELLQTVGETMVERERLRREVAALTAEGKISAIVLGILPPAIGAVMYVVNPAYMQVLFTDIKGKVILVAGVVSALVGFAWMKKTIAIEI